MIEKILITVGLPASGKTTWANEYYKKNNKYRQYSHDNYIVQHLDLDNEKEWHRKFYNKSVNIESIIKRKINKDAKEVIIDGLFLNTNDIIELISFMNLNNVVYEIHYWIPDIEKCLYNDIGRRNEDSAITIKNAKIEQPNIDVIKAECGNKNIKELTLVKHKIIEKPFWKLKCDENGIDVDDEKYMYSDSWSLGGTWGDCWGHEGTIESERQPEFVEFDKLLEEICSSITFLQYKNIYNSCVDTVESSHGDYYGGCETTCRYRCNLETLFNLLKEKDLIN